MLKNKKQFYITELNMGDDGLESYTDYSGPFTLSKARRIMEKELRKRNHGGVIREQVFWEAFGRNWGSIWDASDGSM